MPFVASFARSRHTEDTVEESNNGGVDLQLIRVALEVMGVVGDYEFLEGDTGFFQASDQVGGLAEANVAIVVAVNQKDRGFPGCDG